MTQTQIDELAKTLAHIISNEKGKEQCRKSVTGEKKEYSAIAS